MTDAGGTIAILIADDHAIFRAGLRKLLETEDDFEVVGEAADGEEAVDKVQRLSPDVLLLDLAMPRLPGLETLRELAGKRSEVRILLLTAAIEKEQIVEALQLGARGVVLKESAIEVLFKSIRAVMAGECWVGRDRVSDLVQCLKDLATPEQGSPMRPSFGLTPREQEVVAAVVAGGTNKDIARQFSVSEQTVKHHLTNIYDKVGVSTRLELALFAIHHQLLP